MGRQARATLDKPSYSARPAWGEEVVVVSREDEPEDDKASWMQEELERIWQLT